MSTSRGRPPRGLRLAGGIIGSTRAHCSSVRSEGYTFRERPSCSICAHSSAEGIGANYLTNLLFCQAMFPDSLLEPTKTRLVAFGRFAERDAKRHGKRRETFTFLGLTLYCTRN